MTKTAPLQTAIRAAALAAAITALPALAMAMPKVGDKVGNPTEAKAALEAAGCMTPEFEAEDGKIEAKCHDAAKKLYEVYIDAKTGTVAKVKEND
ncbi:PepSY domain-containing protein [Frigidibacter sp. MR17.14]|uniref:PepSY domain-containing protein n=1 Tax=Frigidibacter sp. MR17.14 TaxID=3126509 RepID=UPI003012C89D